MHIENLLEEEEQNYTPVNKKQNTENNQSNYNNTTNTSRYTKEYSAKSESLFIVYLKKSFLEQKLKRTAEVTIKIQITNS